MRRLEKTKEVRSGRLEPGSTSPRDRPRPPSRPPVPPCTQAAVDRATGQVLLQFLFASGAVLPPSVRRRPPVPVSPRLP